MNEYQKRLKSLMDDYVNLVYDLTRIREIVRLVQRI